VEPASDPELEVQVRAGRVAGGADGPDALAGADRLAVRHDGRAAMEVEVDVRAVGAGVVEDDVLARSGGRIARREDRRGARRDQWGSVGRGDVLALVDVVA